jgi:hypothetical protein
MIRLLAAALLLSTGALAQEPESAAPTVSAVLDPQGPVIVGTSVRVSLTVLVPSYMPDPPVWPDLQIADAITRLPERGTRPVTERVGGESWSGLTRTYEIVPQRAADYDLAGAEIAVTYADPASNAPVRTTLPVPDIAFAASIPAGAHDLDPFLAASRLTVSAAVDGLPETPKPGDAFTLILTTTASGPPAMLLPPLAHRLTPPAGLRAYPRQPELADTPGERGAPGTASRTEAIAYVIERPGRYVLPAVSVGWWNTEANAVQTAATSPITIDVPVPAGWRDATAAEARGGRWIVPAVVGSLAAAGVALILARRRGVGARRERSERALFRDLRRAVRSAPVGAVRPSFAAWRAALGPDAAARLQPAEHALLALERTAFGPASGARPDRDLRRQLLAALAAARAGHRPEAHRSALPALNPP